MILLNHQFTLLAVNAAEAGRMFGLDQQQVINTAIMLFNVALLAFVMSKLLYNPVRNFMHKRSEKIRAIIEDTLKESEAMTALKAEYEGKLREASAQGEQIIEEARKHAAERARLIIADAKTEADSLKNRALTDIEMERARAREEMKQAIIEVSAAMTEKLVAASVDRDVHERLFAQTMVELEGTSWHG
jgi:F-type H+-transporting ATPase subunit b